MTNKPVSHDFGKSGTKPKKETLELEGKVVEALPSAIFRVQIDLPAGGRSADQAGKAGSGQEVLAYLAGRLRMHRIRILPGDRVRVELTPYDLKRGRITRRL